MRAFANVAGCITPVLSTQGRQMVDRDIPQLVLVIRDYINLDSKLCKSEIECTSFYADAVMPRPPVTRVRVLAVFVGGIHTTGFLQPGVLHLVREALALPDVHWAWEGWTTIVLDGPGRSALSAPMYFSNHNTAGHIRKLGPK
jgi:hypothetical protein